MCVDASKPASQADEHLTNRLHLNALPVYVDCTLFECFERFLPNFERCLLEGGEGMKRGGEGRGGRHSSIQVKNPTNGSGWMSLLSTKGV